jgi:hypothetical protein
MHTPARASADRARESRVQLQLQMRLLAVGGEAFVTDHKPNNVPKIEFAHPRFHWRVRHREKCHVARRRCCDAKVPRGTFLTEPVYSHEN